MFLKKKNLDKPKKKSIKIEREREEGKGNNNNSLKKRNELRQSELEFTQDDGT